MRRGWRRVVHHLLHMAAPGPHWARTGPDTRKKTPDVPDPPRKHVCRNTTKHAASDLRCFACRSPNVTGACATCRHAVYCDAACAERDASEHACVRYELELASGATFDNGGLLYVRIKQNEESDDDDDDLATDTDDRIGMKSMPLEIIMKIVSFMSFDSVAALSSMNARYRHLIFKELFFRDFGVRVESTTAEHIYLRSVLRRPIGERHRPYMTIYKQVVDELAYLMADLVRRNYATQTTSIYYIIDKAGGELLFYGTGVSNYPFWLLEQTRPLEYIRKSLFVAKRGAPTSDDGLEEFFSHLMCNGHPRIELVRVSLDPTAMNQIRYQRDPPPFNPDVIRESIGYINRVGIYTGDTTYGNDAPPSDHEFARYIMPACDVLYKNHYERR